MSYNPEDYAGGFYNLADDFDDEAEGCDDCMTFPCSCDAPPEIG